MKKHLKLLSLAAALCGAVACSSSSGGTSSTTAGPGNTGSSSGGASGTAAGGSGTGSGTAAGGNGTAAGTTGTTGGLPQPTTYPCVDGGNAYQPTTNLPAGVASCWCNPGIGLADPSDAGAQIVASCPQHGAMPDNNIPQPPPAGNESLPLWTSGPFPQPAP